MWVPYFKDLQKLVDKSNLLNLDILAILNTRHNTLMKRLSISYRKDDILNSINKKLNKRIQSSLNFADEVNKPINKKKVISLVPPTNTIIYSYYLTFFFHKFSTTPAMTIAIPNRLIMP